MSSNITRRDFIKRIGIASLAFYGLSLPGCKSGFSRDLKYGPRKKRGNDIKKGLYIAKGSDDPGKLTRAAVDAAGGMKKLVRKGDVVVVKPNIGWDRRPDQAANTNPAVVAALVSMAFEAGASEVKVFDRSCNEAKRCYSKSGIATAAKNAGADVSFMDDDRFVSVSIPGAVILREWPLYKDVMEADVFINCPIVKDHGATGLTAGMKNLMGCVGDDRGAWHVGNISQRIADVQLAIKSDLVVLDAFRVLTANGPQGGRKSDVKTLNTIAVSTDIVAADAFAAGILDLDPMDIEHIKIAANMGLGKIKPSVVKEITL